MGLERRPCAAADRFRGRRRIADIRPFGTGHVHQTYLVSLENGERFILQRVNTRIFPRPDLIMANLRVLTEHVSTRLARACLGGGRRWEVPGVLLAEGGCDHWVDADGSFWRAQRFVDRARAGEVVRDAGQAREVGWALGTFHSLVADLPPERLADTLPGFHVTPLYLQRCDEALQRCPPRPSPEVALCLRFIEARRAITSVLEDGRAAGMLSPCAIHGDPKVTNVLFDEATGQAVALIDLDTVKPGLVQYDIGDCLRSACNPIGEEAESLDAVRFDPDLCRAVLEGYRSANGGCAAEFVYEAVRLIAFELGLRFLTDFLEGDAYFRTHRRGQNLDRALVQFRLVESIEASETQIRQIARSLGSARAAGSGDHRDHASKEGGP